MAFNVFTQYTDSTNVVRTASYSQQTSAEAEAILEALFADTTSTFGSFRVSQAPAVKTASAAPAALTAPAAVKAI